MPLALRLTVDKIIAMLVEGEEVWRREVEVRERGILFGVGEIWRLRDSTCAGGRRSREGQGKSVFTRTFDDLDDWIGGE